MGGSWHLDNRKATSRDSIHEKCKTYIKFGDYSYQQQSSNNVSGNETNEQRTLLGAPGLTTRNKKLLGAPGMATRSKDAIEGQVRLLKVPSTRWVLSFPHRQPPKADGLWRRQAQSCIPGAIESIESQIILDHLSISALVDI